jgi:acetyl esterase/lipase
MPTMKLRKMKLPRLLLACAMLAAPLAAPALAQMPSRAPIPQPLPVPQRFTIWPGIAPGTDPARAKEPEVAKDYSVKNVHEPSITFFPADPRHNTGASVIVIPGGGHGFLVWTTEGVDVAPRLNQMGLNVFVLKYRLAREAGSKYTIEGDAAADARRAIRYVRAHAAQFGIDPARLGVMGFSAGGEVVALVADNAEPARNWKLDATDALSARPDFQMLVFPGPLGIIGNAPANAIAKAPPAFMVSGTDDKCCTPPALGLYTALRDAGHSPEIHLYSGADHAFNMGERSSLLTIIHWPDRLADWLADNGWLDGKGSPPKL